jgi:hypothetical protein
MNDALDIVQRFVSVRDGRIAAVGAEPADRRKPHVVWNYLSSRTRRA